MGREIRRVPKNWEHPQKEEYSHLKRESEMQYIPKFDESYIAASNEWIENFNKFEPDEDCLYFWEYEGNPPDEEYYRPDWKPEEMTWYQVYETVSEGTPVTPPFETKKELVDYLVVNGDFWCQTRPDENPPSRASTEAFVDGGWAPSMVIAGGQLLSGVESCGLLKNKSDK